MQIRRLGGKNKRFYSRRGENTVHKLLAIEYSGNRQARSAIDIAVRLLYFKRIFAVSKVKTMRFAIQERKSDHHGNDDKNNPPRHILPPENRYCNAPEMMIRGCQGLKSCIFRGRRKKAEAWRFARGIRAVEALRMPDE
ncbi:hypothetical protein SDC9_130251 [bioreactor metagenome]|uniref:Uncharacterized protein n=1 Tax=bioreactor metagenome TaxID=1076179 RepID=A0A645D2A4_9ZZZZ